MAQQGGGDGGGIAGKRAKLPSSSTASIAAGEDRLSALPDDVLVVILLGLGTTAEAARTGVLSRRWRRVWPLLPELRFPLAPDGRGIREALAAPGAPALLRRIFVTAEDSGPGSLRAWLPDAARRLSGDLVYCNMMLPTEEVSEDAAGEEGAVQLPCFENATGIDLTLGFLGLVLPLAGTFTRLTELRLCRLGLHGPCDLGDVVSSSRCPNLQKLSVDTVRVMDKLAICSESLLQVDLAFLHGLRQLSIVAPLLEELQLVGCFNNSQPIVNISTPQLVSLIWRDPYDPSSVQLGNLGRLQRLGANTFLVYGQHDNRQNRDFRRLMQQFPFIHGLKIWLSYGMDTRIFPYLMEEITTLPRTASLTISIFNRGHAFGPSSFHVLRLCTGIRRLKLALCILRGFEDVCRSGCNCDQPTNWKADELLLDCLENVEICNLEGAEHEVVFMKRLFSWAPVLKRMRITFESSVSKRKARELLPILSSLSRPETAVEFYMYDGPGKRSALLLDPEDQGAAS